MMEKKVPGVIKCKAAVAWKPNEPICIEEVEVEVPQKGEVRIKILASGVCHTDAYTLSGLDSEGVFPCILGHEGCGVVESVGEGVSSVMEGDIVVPLYIPECGECKFCRSDRRTNLCGKIRESQGKGVMPDGTSRFRSIRTGQSIYHYMGCSTFIEFTVLPEIAVAKVNIPNPPIDQCCLMGCGVTTGYGAAINSIKHKQSAVAVFGLGGVGLSVIQGAVSRGASKIVGIDINEDKFPLALQMGATECINPAKVTASSLQNYLVQSSDGGFDYTFECIGNVDTMRVALESCHKGWGESIIIGVAGAGQEISTRPFQLVTGRVWRGSAFGGVKGRSELPKLMEKAFIDKEINVESLITGRISLEQINNAFEDLHNGKRYHSQY